MYIGASCRTKVHVVTVIETTLIIIIINDSNNTFWRQSVFVSSLIYRICYFFAFPFSWAVPNDISLV